MSERIDSPPWEKQLLEETPQPYTRNWQERWGYKIQAVALLGSSGGLGIESGLFLNEASKYSERAKIYKNLGRDALTEAYSSASHGFKLAAIGWFGLSTMAALFGLKAIISDRHAAKAAHQPSIPELQ